ncbi:MAG: radical SAM protein [Gemmatimonadetes bacterium]|nr:radical SAM protein [Gemmatimonadota bacterium]
MRKLKIAVIDLVTKGPTRALYARVMNPNLTSIMPQVVSVWCEESGHDVKFICYTGFENLLDEVPTDTDLVFVTAFTQAAQLSYAISNMCRQRGAVTVLGGPHARCYPEDARKYFDYVTGFTDQAALNEILADLEQHRPYGVHIAAAQHPASLPSVEQRWKFIDAVLAKAPTIKIVPMIGSLGCPYTCSFCIDSVVDYQPLSFDQMREDLRFLLTKFKRPRVGWHDPNFGVRFNDYLDAIEEAVPVNSIDHVAESSLSLLSEPHLQRLKKNGFKAILPGIESWYDLGNKSKTGARKGEEKVQQVSDHINMILEYVPYVQANFVLGLDCDEGDEPFELTKTFIDKTPAVFPGYSLLSAFGEAAPLNLELQRDGRVLPFPFHFLNNHHAMNVRPKNYEWRDFYDHVIDLTEYSFSWRTIGRRFRSQGPSIPGWMNVLRAVSSEGFGRIKYYRMIRGLLDTDASMKRFFEGETTEVPEFFVNRIKNDLGDFWDYLPEGAMEHDPTAYLKKHESTRKLVELQA